MPSKPIRIWSIFSWFVIRPYNLDHRTLFFYPRPTQESPETAQTGDIFFITLCAVICGADDWVSIETLGKAKEGWFDEVLGLENGIPSHDTFGNMFAVINIEEFNSCFSRWVNDLVDLSGGDIIAIDGKCSAA